MQKYALESRKLDTDMAHDQMLMQFGDRSKNVDMSVFILELPHLAQTTFLSNDRSVANASLESVLRKIEPLKLPVLLIGAADNRTRAAIAWLRSKQLNVAVIALQARFGQSDGGDVLSDPLPLGALPYALIERWRQQSAGSKTVAEPTDTAIDWLSLIKFGGAAPPLRSSAAVRSSFARGSRLPQSAARSPMSRAKVLMVQGTSSSVGKTFMVTALARYFSNRGVLVAPFKAQNMSNNARVVAGGEIGTAQYFQAIAARVKPDVRMNPVLIKPQADSMKIVIDGKADKETAQLPWRLRKPLFWPHVVRSLRSLCDEYQMVIIEGAGSPAETYLANNDVVNMRVAEEVDATVILVGDAGRGGVFAHLFGTWALMPEAHKRLVKAFVLNLSFQGGRPEMFLPGCDHLARITGGIPTLGIVPRIDSVLPEEDRLRSLEGRGRGGAMRVVIAAYPHGSNLDEFSAIQSSENIETRWGQNPEDFVNADVIILPGSRDVMQDLNWMRERAIDAAILKAAGDGKRVLGICGGLQMLGETIEDPVGIEGSGTGLSLLAIKTVFRLEKIQRETAVTFANVPGPWGPLSELKLSGYEIRHGLSEATRGNDSTVELVSGGMAFISGSVLGIYLHGLFENSQVLDRMFGLREDFWQRLEDDLERMAKLVEDNLDMDALMKLAAQ